MKNTAAGINLSKTGLENIGDHGQVHKVHLQLEKGIIFMNQDASKPEFIRYFDFLNTFASSRILFLYVDTTCCREREGKGLVVLRCPYLCPGGRHKAHELGNGLGWQGGGQVQRADGERDRNLV